MIRNDHTFIELRGTIHDFKVIGKNKIGIRGIYKNVKCERCGIRGRRYANSAFISIRKQYSQKKYPLCNMKKVKNPEGKYIKILGLITNRRHIGISPRVKPEYKDKSLFTGSIHKVLSMENYPQNNDSKGVWVMGKLEPVKLFNFEFIFVDVKIKKKSKRMSKPKSKRTKY